MILGGTQALRTQHLAQFTAERLMFESDYHCSTPSLPNREPSSVGKGLIWRQMQNAVEPNSGPSALSGGIENDRCGGRYVERVNARHHGDPNNAIGLGNCIGW